MVNHRTQKTSKQQSPDISVVIPLFNEEESIQELFSQIKDTMHRLNMRFEVVFVDDGSTDRSFTVLNSIFKKYPNIVKVVSFRRNYGKSAALTAGFKEAEGEMIVTMDADLQDDPGEIPSLIEMLGNKYDLVSGWKRKRHDSPVFTLPSRIANTVIRWLTGLYIHDSNCGLKIYRCEVAKELRIYGDLYRYIPILAHQSGFRVGEKVVEHHPRKYGHSKYTIGKFYRGFLDLITILFIAKYIRKPLHFFGVWGMISLAIGSVIDGWLIIERLLGRISLSNRPLFMVGFLFIIIGVQFISLGLLGEMISRHERNDETYSIRENLK